MSSVKTIHAFNEFAKEHISIYETYNWSYTTYGRYISIIEQHIMPVFGGFEFRHIDNRMISHYYHSLHIAIPVIVPSTIRATYKISQTMFNKAMEWNLVSRNPTIGVMVTKISNVDRMFWTHEQICLALENCDDIVLSLGMQLVFYYALRKGEILVLR